MNPPARFPRRVALAAALLVALPTLGGCAVVMVAGTAASLAVGGASLAVDAAVGAAKLTGAAAGAAVDAVLPGDAD